MFARIRLRRHGRRSIPTVTRRAIARTLALLGLAAASATPIALNGQTSSSRGQSDEFHERPRDFARDLERQAETDAAWRKASEGVMQMEKVTYRSRVGDLDVPAFVFQPLRQRGPRGHAAIVWVHENIRGHLYEHDIPCNDEDVNIEEDLPLVDALRSRKPALAETKVYKNPPGGHTFDRRVDPTTWQPENTREQRDSWNRVWTFLDWHLDPFRDAAASTNGQR